MLQLIRTNAAAAAAAATGVYCHNNKEAIAVLQSVRTSQLELHVIYQTFNARFMPLLLLRHL